jgi:hypothetical protein
LLQRALKYGSSSRPQSSQRTRCRIPAMPPSQEEPARSSPGPGGTPAPPPVVVFPLLPPPRPSLFVLFLLSIKHSGEWHLLCRFHIPAFVIFQPSLVLSKAAGTEACRKVKCACAHN